MRQVHDFPWETDWLSSFFSSCTERDEIGLVPNGLPPPPSRNSVACKITRYTSHWLHAIQSAQALQIDLVSHVRRSLLLAEHEMEPRRRGLPVATESWQLSPPTRSHLPSHFFFFPKVVRGALGDGHKGSSRVARHILGQESWAPLVPPAPPMDRRLLCMRLPFRLIPLRRHSCCRPWNAVAP